MFPDLAEAGRISYVLIIRFLFSLGVESIQLIMSVGVFDVDDLLLNTLGALIGWCLYRLIWKVGNRAIRVYPPWEVVKSKQAEITQKWQTKYFCRIDHSIDLEKVKKLYKNN